MFFKCPRWPIRLCARELWTFWHLYRLSGFVGSRIWGSFRSFVVHILIHFCCISPSIILNRLTDQQPTWKTSSSGTVGTLTRHWTCQKSGCTSISVPLTVDWPVMVPHYHSMAVLRSLLYHVYRSPYFDAAVLAPRALRDDCLEPVQIMVLSSSCIAWWWSSWRWMGFCWCSNILVNSVAWLRLQARLAGTSKQTEVSPSSKRWFISLALCLASWKRSQQGQYGPITNPFQPSCDKCSKWIADFVHFRMGSSSTCCWKQDVRTCSRPARLWASVQPERDCVLLSSPSAFVSSCPSVFLQFGRFCLWYRQRWAKKSCWNVG